MTKQVSIPDAEWESFKQSATYILNNALSGGSGGNKTDAEYTHEAQFQLVNPNGEGPLLSSVEDGDTLFGKRKPDPEVVVATDNHLRNDDVDADGDWYRIPKLDTHESDAKKKETRRMAKEEKQAVKDFLKAGREEYDGEWPFRARFVDDEAEGTYGRPLADIVRESDGRSLTQYMLDTFPNRDIIYGGK